MWNIVTLVGIGVTALTIPPVLLQLRKHPRGLFVLFFAEMWERFSYYGMRGILITYMTQHFLFGDELAQGQYGAYTSLAYLMPLIGGFLADKVLGTRKAIAFGALLLVAGHLAMAIEQKPATQHLTYQGQTYDFVSEGRQDQRNVQLKVGEGLYSFGPAADGGLAINGLPADAPLPAVLPKGSYETSVSGVIPVYKSIFYLALSLIIMGIGFLKPNISSIVGQLYGENDPRRDSGFTLYYYGINMGAFWASILCAGLGLVYGWAWGFGLAGVGMLAGFVVFTLGKPLLEGKGEPPNPEALKQKVVGPINREWLTYGLSLLGVGAVYLLVQREPMVNWLLLICAIGVLAYFGVYMATKCTAVEAQRIILALILISASVMFWTLFELAGTALNQFAERNTALPSNGFLTISSGQTQSFNAGFILLLAPVFAAGWVWLARHKKEPNDPMKFALALMQVGAGFLVLVWGAMYADAAAKVPLVFLVLLYLLHTTGELCLSPVGLSAMTKLAPAAVLSTLMATWFLASSGAQALGAQISKLTAAETVGGQVLDPHAALTTYVGVFQQIGIGAIVLGVALAAASPWLKKLAHAPVGGDGVLTESAELAAAAKTRAPN
jgi:POT family proton-dependent oligopeptide transporter